MFSTSQALERPPVNNFELLNAFFEYIAEGNSQASFINKYNASKPNDIAPLTLGLLRRMIVEEKQFCTDFELAKRFSADSAVDQIIDIADSASSPLGVMVAKLRIDARMVVAAKYHHGAYGSKSQDTNTIDDQRQEENIESPALQFDIQSVPSGHFVTRESAKEYSK